MKSLGEHALTEGAGEDDFVTVLPCLVHRSDYLYILPNSINQMVFFYWPFLFSVPTKRKTTCSPLEALGEGECQSPTVSVDHKGFLRLVQIMERAKSTVYSIPVKGSPFFKCVVSIGALPLRGGRV